MLRRAVGLVPRRAPLVRQAPPCVPSDQLPRHRPSQTPRAPRAAETRRRAPDRGSGTGMNRHSKCWSNSARMALRGVVTMVRKARRGSRANHVSSNGESSSDRIALSAVDGCSPRPCRRCRRCRRHHRRPPPVPAPPPPLPSPPPPDPSPPPPCHHHLHHHNHHHRRRCCRRRPRRRRRRRRCTPAAVAAAVRL